MDRAVRHGRPFDDGQDLGINLRNYQNDGVCPLAHSASFFDGRSSMSDHGGRRRRRRALPWSTSSTPARRVRARAIQGSASGDAMAEAFRRAEGSEISSISPTVDWVKQELTFQLKFPARA